MKNPWKVIHINYNGSNGTPLVVQWLRLRTPDAGGPSYFPGQGTRSLMPQLKEPACGNEDPACHN